MENKTYEDGVKDALDIIDYHYFGKRLGDDKQTRKNMRVVIKKAEKMKTSEYALWNFVKELKKTIGNLANISEEDFIKLVKKTEKV